jgi:hypothetical protein
MVGEHGSSIIVHYHAIMETNCDIGIVVDPMETPDYSVLSSQPIDMSGLILKPVGHILLSF